MNIVTTVTVGSESTICVKTDGIKIQLEVDGESASLTFEEALELGNLLHAASYRSRPEPSLPRALGAAAGASASASDEAVG